MHLVWVYAYMGVFKSLMVGCSVTFDYNELGNPSAGPCIWGFLVSLPQYRVVGPCDF